LYKLSIGAKNVENSKGQEVRGFELVFYKEEESVVVDVNEGDSPSESGSRIYLLGDSSGNIIIPKPGETRTYEYNTTELFNKVEIFVVLKSGRVCPDVSDSIRLAGMVCI
jgi:hypothetical protein